MSPVNTRAHTRVQGSTALTQALYTISLASVTENNVGADSIIY
jgi:hypothetical protein